MKSLIVEVEFMIVGTRTFKVPFDVIARDKADYVSGLAPQNPVHKKLIYKVAFETAMEDEYAIEEWYEEHMTFEDVWEYSEDVTIEDNFIITELKNS